MHRAQILGICISRLADAPRSLSECFAIFELIHALVDTAPVLQRVTREVCVGGGCHASSHARARASAAPTILPTLCHTTLPAVPFLTRARLHG